MKREMKKTPTIPTLAISCRYLSFSLVVDRIMRSIGIPSWMSLMATRSGLIIGSPYFSGADSK